MFRGIIKIIILIALVITSMVLTFKIWNYTPEIADVENTLNEKTATIGPRNNDNIKSIFMPFQVLWHQEQNIKGTNDSDTIMELTNYIAGNQVKQIHVLPNDSRFSAKDIGEHFVIFDFTVGIPDSMYLTSVLDMSLKSRENATFKRMIVDYQSKDQLMLYLIGDKKILQLETTAESSGFKKQLNTTKNELIKYVGIITNESTTDEKTNLYAPLNTNHAKSYRYMADRINVDDINNAVLDDKEHVIKRSRKDGTTYFSNSGVVSIKNDEFYKYNNLTEAENTKEDPRDNLVKSFSFISNHGGFTDDYRLFAIKPNKAINYQMFLSGLPVFNKNGLSEISVIWGQKKEYEYSRGLLSTSVAVPSTTPAKQLPTAEQVRYQLASNKHYDFENVTQILLGYELKRSQTSEIQIQSTLNFEPGWYVEYKGEWKKFEHGRLR